MNIMKFQGKNEDEALKLAKKELGDNVVIFNTKKIKAKGLFSFLKKSVVEITVAAKENDDAANKVKADIASAVSSVDRLRAKAETQVEKPVSSENKLVTEKLDSIQTLLEEKLKKADIPAPVEKIVAAGKNDVKKEADEVEISEPTPEILDFVKILYNTMVDNEIREQYANQMIDDIVKNYNKDMTMEYILSHIYQKMVLKFGTSQYIEPSEKGPKIIYFIGPTGVGKTTTLAKIASQLYFTDKKKIAMFTIDTYRIAASDQLSSYANIMDVPMEIIYKTEDMVETYKKYSNYNYILVDTAGHSSKNEEMSENTNAFLHCLDEYAEKEVYLVVSATTKYKDLVNIADYYSKMANYKLIFTKLDETCAYGNLLNLKIHTGAPMSYVTCGQNVPDDFEKFNIQDTVRKLLLDESEYNKNTSKESDKEVKDGVNKVDNINSSNADTKPEE